MITEFLVKKTIRNYQQTQDNKVRSAYGKLSGVVCLTCNILLFIAKLIIGILSGAVSVIADAINNLSDASSNVVSFLGFKLSEKPADKEHPYGHGRYEYLAGLIIAVLILFIGVELFKSGIQKIIANTPVDCSLALFIVLGLSILVKLWMFVFNAYLAKKIGSQTLKATSQDSLNDVITTSAVLVCALLQKFFAIQLDGYMAIAVSLFILWSGIGLIHDTLDPLLGKAPDQAWIKSIQQYILSYPHVLGAHDLMVHDYGIQHKFASVHVELPENIGLVQGHQLIDQMEEAILQQFGVQIVIHLDPVQPNDNWRIFVQECAQQVDNRLSIHDFKAITCNEQTDVYFDCFVPEDLNIPAERIEEYLAENIHKKHPDWQLHITVDSNFLPIQKD